ncbi:MAG: phosphate acyltransferase PlsX [Planctomycetota bacterium]|nr:phosphate acyltransferase PlsX [Planctomycetota bacterium]
MLRIALDAMGGDDAPRAMVEGAVDYARAFPEHQVILVGREHDIVSCLAREGARPGNIRIEHAPEVIGMAEKISALKERPNDSMNRCAQLVKRGQAEAMVLCGNTGCSVAAAQLHLRRIPGVKRAGLLTPLPNPKGHTWVIDCGANSVCKPEHLVDFALLGSAFLESTYGLARPRVGVLSIGEEEGKGDDLTGETMALLKQTNLNVVGLVEGHHVYQGLVDVVVCDGFTGNVLLKASEGVYDALITILKEEIYSSLQTKLGARLLRPAFEGLRRRTHWSLVGGVLLAGVDGVTIIGHGRSNRVAVFHALKQAARAIEGRAIERMRERVQAIVNRAAAVAADASAS